MARDCAACKRRPATETYVGMHDGEMHQAWLCRDCYEVILVSTAHGVQAEDPPDRAVSVQSRERRAV